MMKRKEKKNTKITRVVTVVTINPENKMLIKEANKIELRVSLITMSTPVSVWMGGRRRKTSQLHYLISSIVCNP
jgi:hypothetical protein